MQKAFLFPSLRHIGYDSGFSIPLRDEVELSPDLCAEVSLFSSGNLAARHKFSLSKLNSLFYRGWDVEWFPMSIPTAGDELFCVRLISNLQATKTLPQTNIEGQMLFKQKDDWVSSVLTNFVPLRAPGYQFSPIIHTAHYIACEQDFETITLFMNVKDINYSGLQDGGVLNAEVSSRAGEYYATVQFAVKANSTTEISTDDLIKSINLSEVQASKGVNVKFWGGASQFSILTMYRSRQNGSIGLEHSLAPHYYLPDLFKTNVRALVYQQLRVKL